MMYVYELNMPNLAPFTPRAFAHFFTASPTWRTRSSTSAYLCKQWNGDQGPGSLHMGRSVRFQQLRVVDCQFIVHHDVALEASVRVLERHEGNTCMGDGIDVLAPPRLPKPVRKLMDNAFGIHLSTLADTQVQIRGLPTEQTAQHSVNFQSSKRRCAQALLHLADDPNRWSSAPFMRFTTTFATSSNARSRRCCSERDGSVLL